MPDKSTPAPLSNSPSSRCSTSSPQKPACVARAPSPTRFMATLAAPPGTRVVCMERSTGTGASGEIRSTVPHTYRSSITSPITNTRIDAKSIFDKIQNAGEVLHPRFLLLDVLVPVPFRVDGLMPRRSL